MFGADQISFRFVSWRNSIGFRLCAEILKNFLKKIIKKFWFFKKLENFEKYDPVRKKRFFETLMNFSCLWGMVCKRAESTPHNYPLESIEIYFWACFLFFRKHCQPTQLKPRKSGKCGKIHPKTSKMKCKNAFFPFAGAFSGCPWKNFRMPMKKPSERAKETAT